MAFTTTLATAILLIISLTTAWYFLSQKIPQRIVRMIFALGLFVWSLYILGNITQLQTFGTFYAIAAIGAAIIPIITFMLAKTSKLSQVENSILDRINFRKSSTQVDKQSLLKGLLIPIIIGIGITVFIFSSQGQSNPTNMIGVPNFALYTLSAEPSETGKVLASSMVGFVENALFFGICELVFVLFVLLNPNRWAEFFNLGGAIIGTGIIAGLFHKLAYSGQQVAMVSAMIMFGLWCALFVIGENLGADGELAGNVHHFSHNFWVSS